MSSREFDLVGDVDEAWKGFRRRLADRIASLDEEMLTVTVETGVDEDELVGSAPFLQFVAVDDECGVEAASNHVLDPRSELSAAAEERLTELGWEPPAVDEAGEPVSGRELYSMEFEPRDADLVAVLAVQTLREVYGCPHPSFLDADGLEGLRHPSGALCAGHDDEPVEPPELEFPESPERLSELIDLTLAPMYESPLMHDDDGDVPLRVGTSVVYVRVGGPPPAVDLYAELVVGVTDHERAVREAGQLTGSHDSAKFHLHGDRILMTYRLCAWPFVPAQLQAALETFCDGIDDTARALAEKVGGRCFLDEESDESAESEETLRTPPSRPRPTPTQESEQMIGLLELLHEGALEASTVAALFDHNRLELIRRLVAIRTGAQECDEHDPEIVLRHLRQALRFVVDGEAARPSRRSAGRRRTHQESLLSDEDLGEQSLDRGLWSA